MNKYLAQALLAAEKELNRNRAELDTIIRLSEKHRVLPALQNNNLLSSASFAINEADRALRSVIEQSIPPAAEGEPVNIYERLREAAK